MAPRSRGNRKSPLLNLLFEPKIFKDQSRCGSQCMSTFCYGSRLILHDCWDRRTCIHGLFGMLSSWTIVINSDISCWFFLGLRCLCDLGKLPNVGNCCHWICMADFGQQLPIRQHHLKTLERHMQLMRDAFVNM